MIKVITKDGIMELPINDVVNRIAIKYGWKGEEVLNSFVAVDSAAALLNDWVAEEVCIFIDDWLIVPTYITNECKVLPT